MVASAGFAEVARCVRLEQRKWTADAATPANQNE